MPNYHPLHIFYPEKDKRENFKVTFELTINVRRTLNESKAGLIVCAFMEEAWEL